MRVTWAVTCVCWGVLALMTTAWASDDVIGDPFISLIKEVESQPFFPSLTTSHRVLTFEMLTAAETNNLRVLLDRLGYVELLRYLDALTKDFSHRFITYSIQRLEMEEAMLSS